jgi:hypothetical protein
VPALMRRRKGVISTGAPKSQHQQGQGLSAASSFFKGQVVHIADNGAFNQPVSVKLNMKTALNSVPPAFYIYSFIL